LSWGALLRAHARHTDSSLRSRRYSAGGYKKEQSVSIFGKGDGIDWTGKQNRKGPDSGVIGKKVPFKKGYKPPKIDDDGDAPKKKFFGLF
jgi:hypothetical protein